jgi:hypothetical protein
MRRTLRTGNRSSEVERARDHTGGSRLRAGARRLAVALAAVVALVAAVAPQALAAGQQKDHFRDIGTFVDDDFCGTGQEIDGAFNVVVNEFSAPHNGGEEKIVVSGKTSLRNPVTGDVAINHFAGPVWNTFISGDPDGVHVEESTVKGLPEMWKLEHGRRLIRDAGYVVIRSTFDGDELVSQDVLVNKGPHPDLDSEFELFCQTLVPALGIAP